MKRLTKKAEDLLKEILEHRYENGNCNVSYWKERFENLTTGDDMLLRSLFKELSESNMISVGWADNYPYILTLLGQGTAYFDEIAREDERLNTNSYVNNFYGSASNIQIQQGSSGTKQIINGNDDTYDCIKELIDTIKKYDAALNSEFGEAADDLRDSGKKLEEAMKKDSNKDKIKSVVAYIRDLSVNAGGGLIAAGLIEIATRILG